MTREEHEYYLECKAFEKFQLRDNDKRGGSALELVFDRIAYEEYLESREDDFDEAAYYYGYNY